MTRDEVIDLLTLMASRDRRTVGKTDVTAWHRDVGDLSFADAQEAVSQHYQQSREWIMPYDVRQRVKAIRAGRIAQSLIPPPPPELADNPRAYQAQLQASIRDAADGNALPLALEPGINMGDRAGHPSSLRAALTGLRARLGPAHATRAIESPRQVAARQARESRSDDAEPESEAS